MNYGLEISESLIMIRCLQSKDSFLVSTWFWEPDWEYENLIVDDTCWWRKSLVTYFIINQSLQELPGWAGLSASLELENSTTEKISAFSQQFSAISQKFSAIYFRLAKSIFYETLYENNFIIACNLFPTDSRQNHFGNYSSEEIIENHLQ